MNPEHLSGDDGRLLPDAHGSVRRVCDMCGRESDMGHLTVHHSVAVGHETFCEFCSPENMNVPLRWCEDASGNRSMIAK